MSLKSRHVYALLHCDVMIVDSDWLNSITCGCFKSPERDDVIKEQFPCGSVVHFVSK